MDFLQITYRKGIIMIIIEKSLSHFIEAVLVLNVGLGCIGIRLKLTKVFWMGVLFSVFIQNLRSYYLQNNIPLGTHSIILLISACLLLTFIGKQTLLNSIVAILISWSILIFGEGVFLIPFLHFVRLDLFSILDRPGATLFATILADIPLIIIFIITYIFKITLIPLDLFSK